MVAITAWLVLGVVALAHVVTLFLLWRIRRARRRGLRRDGGTTFGFGWSIAEPNRGIGRHNGRAYRFVNLDVRAYMRIPFNVIYRFWRHVSFAMFAPWPEDDSGLSLGAYWKKRALAVEEELTRIRMEEKT
jgi:hypothetical protein